MIQPALPETALGHRVFFAARHRPADLADLHQSAIPIHPIVDLSDLDTLNVLARSALRYESKAVFLGNARVDAKDCEYWIAALEQRYGVKFYFTG